MVSSNALSLYEVLSRQDLTSQAFIPFPDIDLCALRWDDVVIWFEVKEECLIERPYAEPYRVRGKDSRLVRRSRLGPQMSAVERMSRGPVISIRFV